MGTINLPKKVMLFTGLLFNSSVDKDHILEVLEQNFGQVVLSSKLFLFTQTRYYEKEMGNEILRLFVAFEPLIEPDSIGEVKIRTNEIETAIFSRAGNRVVNIDPGYITSAKVILATTKNFQHRIYIGKGIYAEVTLRYRKRSFEPWEWTFPDYRREESIAFFNRLRDLYRTIMSKGVR